MHHRRIGLENFSLFAVRMIKVFLLIISAVFWGNLSFISDALDSAEFHYNRLLSPTPRDNCTGTTPIIFITGITGMIGSHVAKALVDKDPCNIVYGLRRPRSDLSSLAGYLTRINLVYGDITDGGRMIDVIREIQPTRIFHFAAQAINSISFGMPELSLDTNIRGTMNLLEAIYRNKLSDMTRVLLAGSSTEYGKSTLNMKIKSISEDLPLDPVSPYGISKLGTEKVANHYVVTHNMKIVTARIFIHIGVGGTDSLAINQFCRQIALAELGLLPPVLIHGLLTTYRDISDAKDSAGAIISLLEMGNSGEAYNVGSGNKIQMKNILRIALSLSKIRMSTQQSPSLLRSFDENSLIANIDKLKELTGWTPNSNMTRVTEEILNYWREKERYLHCRKEGDCNHPFIDIELGVRANAEMIM